MILIIAILIGIPTLAGILDFKFGPSNPRDIDHLEYEKHLYQPQTYWYHR